MAMTCAMVGEAHGFVPRYATVARPGRGALPLSDLLGCVGPAVRWRRNAKQCYRVRAPCVCGHGRTAIGGRWDGQDIDARNGTLSARRWPAMLWARRLSRPRGSRRSSAECGVNACASVMRGMSAGRLDREQGAGRARCASRLLHLHKQVTLEDELPLLVFLIFLVRVLLHPR